MLNNNIQELRKQRNISQQELADYLKIERTSLSKIENGHYNPSSKTITEVASFFNLPVGDIFYA